MDIPQQTQCKNNFSPDFPIEDKSTQDTKYKDFLRVTFNNIEEADYVQSKDSSVYFSENEESPIFSNYFVRYYILILNLKYINGSEN